MTHSESKWSERFTCTWNEGWQFGFLSLQSIGDTKRPPYVDLTETEAQPSNRARCGRATEAGPGPLDKKIGRNIWLYYCLLTCSASLINFLVHEADLSFLTCTFDHSRLRPGLGVPVCAVKRDVRSNS